MKYGFDIISPQSETAVPVKIICEGSRASPKIPAETCRNKLHKYISQPRTHIYMALSGARTRSISHALDFVKRGATSGSYFAKYRATRGFYWMLPSSRSGCCYYLYCCTWRRENLGLSGKTALVAGDIA